MRYLIVASTVCALNANSAWSAEWPPLAPDHETTPRVESSEKDPCGYASAMIVDYGVVRGDMRITYSPKWGQITREDSHLLAHKQTTARLICWDTGTVIVFCDHLPSLKPHAISK